MRKVMAVGLAVVFLIALVIGMGVMFSIRNVNVAYSDYSAEYSEEYERCKTSLEKLKGSSLLFLKNEDIASHLSDEDVIAVESFKKVFPCTVNINLKERIYSYVLKTATGYSLYDIDGKFVKAYTGETAPVCKLDASPYVVLDSTIPEDEVPAMIEFCEMFGSKFGSVRRLVDNVSINSYSYFGLEIVEIKLRSGLTVSIRDWRNSSEQKILRAYEKYTSLPDPDTNKTSGRIIVTDGQLVADYK